MRKQKTFFIISLVGVAFIVWCVAHSQFFGKNFLTFPKFKPFRKRTSVALSKFCNNYKTRERINPNYFYYYNNTVGRRGLLWCKIPKAGSTTLTKLYLRLAGLHPPNEEDDEGFGAQNPDNLTHKVHKVLRENYPKVPLKALQQLITSGSTIKFMVVRDPFERLVSAYRDKLEDYQRDLRFRNGYYYENYGKLMVPGKEFNSTRVPTWSEFISYLLKTSIARFDEHWMPMSRLCSPCATNYDYVIKLEHFQHQIQRPLKMVGVNTPNIGWSHRTGSGNRWIINKYFNNLTLMDIKKLYVKYKRDFQLFGYTPYKYFKLGNK